jgi:hypothetical protein
MSGISSSQGVTHQCARNAPSALSGRPRRSSPHGSRGAHFNLLPGSDTRSSHAPRLSHLHPIFRYPPPEISHDLTRWRKALAHPHARPRRLNHRPRRGLPPHHRVPAHQLLGAGRGLRRRRAAHRSREQHVHRTTLRGAHRQPVRADGCPRLAPRHRGLQRRTPDLLHYHAFHNLLGDFACPRLPIARSETTAE